MGDEGKAVGWLLLADGFAYLSTRSSAKRRSIIDVTAPALRLRNDVVNIDTNLAASATLERRHFFYL
jgi:hypothetical protein